jgi:hypothetical protein
MQKNEKKIYKQINCMKNCLIKLNNRKSNLNTFSKINIPRNSILKKNKTSSNFILYKINSLYNSNDSKENLTKLDEKQLDKSKEIFNNDINSFNSFTSRRNNGVNTIQLDENYLRLISTKNIKNKRASSLLYNIKNNSQFINSLYIPNKKKRADLIKYKYLLGKINYFKRIFHLKDGLTLKSKRNNLSPFQLNIKYNIYNDDLNKSKYLLLQSEEIKSNKNINENFSFPSIPYHKIHNNIRKFRFTSIKIKKDFYQKKNTNQNNNNIGNKKNNLIDNTKDNEENNKSTSPEKIIEDNYNEYLNDISCSESNKSKNEIRSKIKYKKNLEDKITKRIKDLKKKIFNYDKNDINKNIKRNKMYENILKMDKTIKLKKMTFKKRKDAEVNKNINIDNPILRKKLFCN